MSGPTIVQKATNQAATSTTNAITGMFAAPAAGGNLLIGFGTFPTWPAGWAVLETLPAVGNNSIPLTLATKTAVGGETAVAINGGTSYPRQMILLIEVTAGTYRSRVSSGVFGVTNPETLPNITPGLGPVLLIAVADSKQAFAMSVGPAGYTAESEFVANDGGNSDRCCAWSRAIATPAGSYGGIITYGAGIDEDHMFQVEVAGAPVGKGFAGEPGGLVW